VRRNLRALFWRWCRVPLEGRDTAFALALDFRVTSALESCVADAPWHLCHSSPKVLGRHVGLIHWKQGELRGEGWLGGGGSWDAEAAKAYVVALNDVPFKAGAAIAIAYPQLAGAGDDSSVWIGTNGEVFHR
jgi:hypothetical protein